MYLCGLCLPLSLYAQCRCGYKVRIYREIIPIRICKRNKRSLSHHNGNLKLSYNSAKFSYKMDVMYACRRHHPPIPSQPYTGYFGGSTGNSTYQPYIPNCVPEPTTLQTL